MICPNCGKELAEGEVCTCTMQGNAQNEETAPAVNVNEESEAVQEAVAETMLTEAEELTEEIPQEETAQEAPAEAVATEEEAYQPSEHIDEQQSYSQPEQNYEGQNAGYNPYENSAYYQPNTPPFSQQAPYYVPITQAPSASTEYPEDYKPRKKYVAVILAATLGIFGIHNFYLGNNGKAIAQILLTTLGSLFFGLGYVACQIWVLVEAVQLLIDKEEADANGYKIMTFAEELAREQKKTE